MGFFLSEYSQMAEWTLKILFFFFVFPRAFEGNVSGALKHLMLTEPTTLTGCQILAINVFVLGLDLEKKK